MTLLMMIGKNLKGRTVRILVTDAENDSGIESDDSVYEWARFASLPLRPISRMSLECMELGYSYPFLVP